jgi:hypothetical protein
VDQRRFLLNAGIFPGLLKKCVIQIKRRPHMHEYSSSMQTPPQALRAAYSIDSGRKVYSFPMR